MFDQLLEMAKSQIGNALQGHTDVNAENHQNITSAASESIVQSITNQVQLIIV